MPRALNYIVWRIAAVRPSCSQCTYVCSAHACPECLQCRQSNFCGTKGFLMPQPKLSGQAHGRRFQYAPPVWRTLTSQWLTTPECYLYPTTPAAMAQNASDMLLWGGFGSHCLVVILLPLPAKQPIHPALGIARGKCSLPKVAR